jgi:hypothetical protein
MAMRVWAVLALAALLTSAQGARCEVIYQYQDPQGVVHLSDTQLTREFQPFFYFRMPKNVDKRQLAGLINRYAKMYGLDPKLVTAMVEVESGFDIKAVSPKGAKGLMQIMPGTAKDLELRESLDAAKNLEAGARYLRQLLDRFGDPRLALAAYNAGPNAVARFGGVPPYPETKSYLDKIQAKYGKRL